MRPLLAAAIAAMALSACSNPIDFVDSVVDEVKAATGRYLVVSASSPAANAAEVSPGSAIAVTFDRAIDPATLEGAISFSPAVEFSYSYDETTMVLTITPAMLDGGTAYTVTIAATVLGADGSALRGAYTVSFTTANVPFGSLSIASTNAGSQAGYSNTTSVILSIKANAQAEKMCYSETADLSDATWLVLDVTKAYTLKDTTNGTRTVYIQFADDAVTNKSQVINATIVYDDVAPTVYAGADFTLLYTDNTAGLAPSASATDATSGIARYSWTGSTYLVFSDPTAATPAITCSLTTLDGGDRYAYLTATDKAGNGASDSVTIYVDVVIPSTPVASCTTTTPGTASSASFSWSAGGGGNGTFQYRLKDYEGTYTAYTSTTSLAYTATSLTYGSNTLYIQERDAAGNWSGIDSASYFRYPTYLLPI